jgi:signal recognition particle subunit SRP54
MAIPLWLFWGGNPTGQFPLRIMYEQFNNVLQMGPMGQVMGMLPGFSNLMNGPGREQASTANLRKYIALMDSMTSKELDNPDITENLRNLSDPSRVKRIVRGSGRSYRDVAELATQYKAMSTMISKMKDQLKPSRVGASNMRSQNAQLAQMGKALSAANPAVLQQIGGMNGLKQMMKAMDSTGGDFSSLASAMGGGGGAGGLAGMLGAAGLGGAGGAKGRRR